MKNADNVEADAEVSISYICDRTVEFLLDEYTAEMTTCDGTVNELITMSASVTGATAKAQYSITSSTTQYVINKDTGVITSVAGEGLTDVELVVQVLDSKSLVSGC